MAVVSARQYNSEMQEPRPVEVEDGIEFILRGNITDADLMAQDLLPDEAYPEIKDQNDPTRVRKGMRSSVHTDDAKLRAAMVEPRYEPESDDPDVLTRRTLRPQHRTAILAWIDGGYGALKRVRTQQEGAGSVRPDADGAHSAQRGVRPEPEVRPSELAMPGLRPVGDRSGAGMGVGGDEPAGAGTYEGRATATV